MEVPLTEAHWESVYLPEHPLILLARGWERQLDTRYDALFYRPELTQRPTGHGCLRTAFLCGVARRAPGLRRRAGGTTDFARTALPVEVWHSAHWRLFVVRDATPLAQPPAILTGVGPDSFTLFAPHPGAFTVRVHFTPYWTIERGTASVHDDPDGRTMLDTHRAGIVRVGIDLL